MTLEATTSLTAVTGPADRAAARIDDLTNRRARALVAAMPRGQVDLGARDRVEQPLDAGSFTETGGFVRARVAGDGAQRPYGDGVVTGYGTVGGRPVCVFAQDSPAFGGSMGEAVGERAVALMELALKTGCPVVGLNGSGGARIQEGVNSPASVASWCFGM